MENVNKQLSPKKKISLAPAVTFLCLEVLAIVGFTLANSVILFASLGLVICILLFVIYRKQVKTDSLTSLAYFIMPLVIYAILTVVSPFARYDLNVADRIFIPIALLAFSFSGYLVAYDHNFSIKTAMIVIYSAIAIYTLINLFITMIQLVPFYAFRFPNGRIYYDGEPSKVTLSAMAYALMGFKMTEVSITYFSFFPTMLFTAVIALFFIPFKKDRQSFIVFVLFAFIGFLALFLTPSKITLLGDLIVIVVVIIMVLFGKQKINGKAFGITMGVIGSLFAIGFLIFFLNSQNWPAVSGLKNFIARNPLLNKIFNGTEIASRFKDIFVDIFAPSKIFGFPNNRILITETGNVAYLSGSWFVDNFMTSGIFGALFFLVSIGFGVTYVVKYYQLKDEPILDKTLLVTFVMTFLVYSLINLDGLPYIFFSTAMPFMSQGMFLIVLFLIGYASKKAIDNKLLIEKQKQEVMNNEEIKKV